METGKKIDVHAHVLPGVDDGARNLAETSRLLRFAISQGFGAVIATPHGSRRSGGTEMERLMELAGQARQEIQKNIRILNYIWGRRPAITKNCRGS